MKRLLLTLSFIVMMVSVPIKAQTVSYTYKPLAAEGCTMKYSVAKKDSSYFIIATVSSDRLVFLSEPTMKIRTFNGDVLSFDGKVIGNDNESIGVITGSIVLPISGIKSTAQFKVTPEQFEQIKMGVSKIRLSMIPMNHERTFKKDKIGKKLYEFYLKLKNQGDDF